MTEPPPRRRRKSLDPKLDIVFWMLFGAEQNRALLISLLNAVLHPREPIESVEVMHPEPERSEVGDKRIALDVRVRLMSGEQVDVEMQTQKRPALRERALYYWARLYVGQLARGDGYDKLRRSVVVLITSFNELESPRFHSVFQARDRTTGDILTEHLELLLIELPELHAALQGNSEPALTDWAKFLTADSDEDLEKLAMDKPVLKQAKDALDRLSADSKARVLAEQREMALISYNLGLYKAHEQGEAVGRAKGEAEGRAKGEAEGRAKMLLQLLTLKFGELPVAARKRVEMANERELQAWTARVLSAESLDAVLTDDC